MKLGSLAQYWEGLAPQTPPGYVRQCKSIALEAVVSVLDVSLLPSRRGWGCFLFLPKEGAFEEDHSGAWHSLWSLRDTGTGVWLTPKSLKTKCRWPAPWEDRRGEQAAFGMACTLQVPEFLWGWCGSQEREPDVVILRRNATKGNT